MSTSLLVERANGWVAFLALDPDDEEPSFVGVFCPVCAASEFEYRPERAEGCV